MPLFDIAELPNGPGRGQKKGIGRIWGKLSQKTTFPETHSTENRQGTFSKLLWLRTGFNRLKVKVGAGGGIERWFSGEAL